MTDEDMTHEELCALALAADPDTAVDDDAVSVWAATGIAASAPLPEWYMPTSVGGVARLCGWRRRAAGVTVALVSSSFLAITAAGLCNTYGQIHL